MNNETKLMLAFLERAPTGAAEELQALPVDQAAALVDSIPAQLSAPVLNTMIPWHAARLLERVSAPRAAMILRQLDFTDAIGLARSIDSAPRNRMLEELPSGFARRLARSLEYPFHQVGAWIEPDVPTLGPDHCVHDAMRALKSSGPVSHVFLSSPEGESFLGLISLQDILRAEISMPLFRLKGKRVDPLSSLASLSSVTFDERWDDVLHMPVVGRRGNLLGGLSRAALRRGTQAAHAMPANRPRPMINEVTRAFGVACVGIMDLMAEAVTGQGIESQRKARR
ncbi:MAG TPA: CBS domain-containing protein [Gammaproteobacteria bacterium]|nr:CBS domain-containing protein [Gammaproteobacteria bacterium]